MDDRENMKGPGKMRFAIISFIIIVCSFNAYAADFTVITEPKSATVYVRNSGEKKRTKLGTTPLTIPASRLKVAQIKSRSFVIEIEKPGYESYNVLAMLIGNNDLDLNVSLELSKEITIYQKIDGLMGRMFEAQRLIRNRSYVEAMDVLSVLEKDFPYSSVIYEIKASAYYLQGDFQNSLVLYRKAFSVNPQNLDSFSMMTYLEESLGLENNKK